MHKYQQSYLSGDFEGWHKDTIYQLDDGSRWQLVHEISEDFYHFRPKVMLWRDGDRYFLQVQSLNDKQEVRPVFTD